MALEASLDEAPSTFIDPLMAPAAVSGEGADTQASVVRRRGAALGFIFATALMDMLAIGLIIPVLPKLVQLFAGGSAAKAAGYVGVFGAVWALMQFIASPIQGALSDHFGRRPVLLFSIFGLGVDYVIMALAPNIGWLLFGRVVSGVTAASFSTANAYIADITAPEKRAQSYGVMGAVFGVGFILGPAAGGLLGAVSPRLPFWVAAGLALANGVYGLFILPESLPKDRRAPFTLAKANPLGSFRLLASHPELSSLATVSLFFFLAHQVLQSTAVLYTGYRYGWSSLSMGLTLAALGAANIVVQGVIVRPFVTRFRERGALYAGLVFAAAGMAVWGWAPNGPWYVAGVPLFAMSGLIQPGLQGLMTRRVGPNEQGRLQGANSGVMAIAGLIGPIFFTQVFAICITGPQASRHPGLPFYIAAAFLLLGLIVAMNVGRVRPATTARPVG